MAKYTKVCRIPGGHTYWQDDSGGILVADDSIENGDPTRTDDGPTYVQRARVTDTHIEFRVWLDRESREAWTSERFSATTLLTLRKALEPLGVVFDMNTLRAAVGEIA